MPVRTYFKGLSLTIYGTPGTLCRWRAKAHGAQARCVVCSGRHKSTALGPTYGTWHKSTAQHVASCIKVGKIRHPSWVGKESMSLKWIPELRTEMRSVAAIR